MAKDTSVTEFDVDGIDADPLPTDSETKGGDGKKGGDPKSTAGDEEDVHAELERLRRKVSEVSESERYWKGVADGKGGSGKRTPTAPVVDDYDGDEDQEEEEEDEEEPELDSEKFIEEFTASPKTALKKAGLVSAKDLKRIVREEAEKIADRKVSKAQKAFSKDMQFVNRYRELGDETSELFRRTKELMDTDPEFQEMRDKGTALRMAARVAKTELTARTAPKPRGDDNDEESAETRRIRSIRAQGGDRGRRRTDDEPEAVTGQTAQVLRAMGVSPKGFQESKKRMGLR